MKNLSILTVLCLLSLATFSAPTITYTPLVTNCSSGNRTISNVSISDATGVQTNGNSVPKIFYRKSGGGAWFSQNGTLTSGNNLSGTWSFTIVTSDMGTLSASDVIEYFIAAQNTAASPSVGSHPSGIVAGNINSITTYPPSPNSYTVGGSPAITTQPAAQTVCAGNNTSFSVVATGAGLTYQWRKNGTDVNGATSATLLLTNVAESDAANYDVVVSGSCSPSVTSNAVALTINNAPAITTQPTAQSSCIGGTVNFGVASTGTGLSYQWRKNGTDINGATSATLSLSNVTTADAANYDVIVSGTCTPTVTSNAVALTINAAPAITTQPAVQSACAGGSVNFSVTATGTGLSYQWRKNGTDINGATSATLSLSNVTANDAANYDVVVSGSCSPSVTSNAVALTINAAPAITTQPTAQSACVGGSASFSVVATGTGLSYQWRKNGTDINGATSATLSLTNINIGDAANYDVVVSGICTPSVTSTAVTLIINDAPAITTQPTAQSACVGGTVSFSVNATGTGLSYQWRKNGTDINGATSATLSLSNVTTADAANYDVVVSGTCSPSVTSTAVALTINDAPAITTQPTAQSACAGGTVNFSVAATGTGLSYQWRKNGTDINGATTNTLVLNNVSAADETTYDVVISNSCSGSVTSNAVTFALKAATNITAGPQSQVICPGSSVTFTVAATGADITYQWMKNGTDINGATNSSYTINNALHSDAGSYSVTVSGCTSATSGDATLDIATANTWLGAISSNWNDAANWCTGIPTSTNSITIPVGTPYSPVISGNANINNLTVPNGALLTIAAGGTLNVFGNIINNGAFDATAGTIVFKGANPQTIPATHAANVVMDGAGGVIVGGNFIVSSTLTLTNGNITLGANNITINGSVNGSVSSHIITNGTGAVISKNINTNAVVIPVSPNAGSYNPVTIANGGGKDYSVSVAAGLTPSIAMNERAINRTWKIIPNTALSSNADVILQFADADANANAQTNNVMEIGLHNGSMWTVISPSTGVTPTGNSNERQVNFQTSQLGILAITTPGGISYPTAITRVDKDITNMQLMPNLVKRNSIMRIVSKKAMKIEFIVTDVSGRTVLKINKQISAGENNISLDLEKLGTGVYHVQGITAEGTTDVMRFIKMN